VPEDPKLGDGVVSLDLADDGDLDAIEAGIHDPDVVRFLGRPQGTARDVLDLNGTRARDGSPTYAIRDRSRRFLGLAWINRTAGDLTAGAVGYWLLPDARGRGHATRAVRILVEHAVRDLGLRRVILVTEPANVRSRAVAERAGFEQLETRVGHGEIDGRSIDVVVYVARLGGE
jgi:RimJ/RimL family protein N-acetyltransferase